MGMQVVLTAPEWVQRLNVHLLSHCNIQMGWQGPMSLGASGRSSRVATARGEVHHRKGTNSPWGCSLQDIPTYRATLALGKTICSDDSVLHAVVGWIRTIPSGLGAMMDQLTS
eukprot:357929-Chlamydomonas_euryale.AAC.5